MRSNLLSTLVISLAIWMSGNAASAQSSVDALGGASDAAQRLFDSSGATRSDTVYDAADVERQAEFLGGEQGLFTFLRNTIHYPDTEFDAGIQGQVLIGFIVERDGRLVQVRTLGPVSPGLDQEAMRAVQQMPNWIPARSNGKPVAMRVILPIQFQLK